MKQIRIILATLSLLMSIFFFFSRFDIIREMFNLGISAVPIGELLLPIVLLIIGIVLLTVKNKKDA